MSASTRRAALGAILAAPLASVPVAATVSPRGDNLPEHEVRFLALIPQLRVLAPPLERAKVFVHALYEDGDRRAGEHPTWERPQAARAWVERAKAIRDRNGYSEAWEAWNNHAMKLENLVAEFMVLRMTTLPAIAWKARIADLLDSWEEQAGSDLSAWAKEDAECA